MSSRGGPGAEAGSSKWRMTVQRTDWAEKFVANPSGRDGADVTRSNDVLLSRSSERRRVERLGHELHEPPARRRSSRAWPAALTAITDSRMPRPSAAGIASSSAVAIRSRLVLHSRTSVPRGSVLREGSPFFARDRLGIIQGHHIA